MARKTQALSRDEIENRLEEAALTLRRLPIAGGPKGFGSSWPEYLREARHAYGYHEATMRVRPNPEEISRMEEAIGWLRLISSGDERRDAVARRVLWMRAEHYRWRQICRHVGLSRSQCWRTWVSALITLEKRLAASAKKGAKVVNRPDGERAADVEDSSSLNAEGG